MHRRITRNLSSEPRRAVEDPPGKAELRKVNCGRTKCHAALDTRGLHQLRARGACALTVIVIVGPCTRGSNPLHRREILCNIRALDQGRPRTRTRGKSALLQHGSLLAK